MDEPNAGMSPITEEGAHVRAPSLPTPRPSRSVGWLVVGGAIAGMALLGLWMAIGAVDIPPRDPRWGQFGFFISPVLAFASALTTGGVLVVVAWLRLVGVTIGRARTAAAIGAIGAPLLYFAAAVGIEAVKSVPSSRTLGLMTFVLPIVCGYGVTLIAALVWTPAPRITAPAPVVAPAQPSQTMIPPMSVTDFWLSVRAVIRKDYEGPTFVLQLRNGSAHRVLLYEWALVTDRATEMIDGWYMKRIIEVGSSHAWETEWEGIRAACVAAGKWIYPAVMVDASPMSDPTKHEPDEVPDLYLPLDPPTGFDWTAG